MMHPILHPILHPIFLGPFKQGFSKKILDAKLDAKLDPRLWPQEKNIGCTQKNRNWMQILCFTISGFWAQNQILDADSVHPILCFVKTMQEIGCRFCVLQFLAFGPKTRNWMQVRCIQFCVFVYCYIMHVFVTLKGAKASARERVSKQRVP
jgi:hypothetical protein